MTVQRIQRTVAKVVDRVARAEWLPVPPERLAGQLRRAASGRIESWHGDHRRDG
jgi:hypothetical protein